MHAGPLPYLETFAKAAELSCFTAAARALGLTQAALSQQVHALERLLAVPLFDRHGGRVLLTEAGRRAPLSGDLILAASSVPGEHLLPAMRKVSRRLASSRRL